MTIRRPRVMTLVVTLPLLAGCVTGRTTLNRDEFAITLEAHKAAEAAGKIGSVSGNLYLLHPAVPTLLRDHPVTLFPLSPGLETTIRQIGDRFAQTHEPLSPETFATDRRPLDDIASALKTPGGEKLHYTTNTEFKEAGFTFMHVPEGRWLLTAQFETPISILLWAVPIDVKAGHNTLKRLNDGNIWVEGLKP